MGAYLRWAVRDYKDSDYSQAQLREKFSGSRADTVFEAVMGQSLLPFVGHIRQIFLPPRSEGIHFKFAAGRRKDFVELIDPSRKVGKIGPDLFLEKGNSPLIPDDPGPANPGQLWRKLSSLKGIGASYRQAGIGSSLHVAFNEDECDIHVDRAGFVKKDAMGRVTWDHNGLIRHVLVDLASDFRDKAPLPLVSMGITDSQNRPIVSATLAPWLAIDLPSRENNNRASWTLGMGLSGTHSFLDGD